MPTAASAPIVNKLLEALPTRVRQGVQQECERVELTFGDVLGGPGERIRDVYFPLDSIISLLASVDSGASLEVAMVGNEGMLGVPLALGVDRWPLRAVVQGKGGAWRLQAGHFKRILADSPVLQHGIDAYAHTLLVQIASTAACTGYHPLEQRLARWLLMTHDRAHSDHFYLTHALLAGMLGVRRSGVTTAAGVLQDRKLIRYSRGGVTVLDRKGLEDASCGCYRSAA